MFMVALTGAVLFAVVWYALELVVLLPIHLAFRRFEIKNLVAYQATFAPLSVTIWNLAFPVPRSFKEFGLGLGPSDWLQQILSAVFVATLFWAIVVRKPKSTQH